MDPAFEAELERRLALIEDPDSDEGPLAPLPWRDVWASIAALVVLSAAVLWWSL